MSSKKRKHTKHKWTANEDELLSSFLKDKRSPKWIKENAFPELSTSAIKGRIQRLKGEEDEETEKKPAKSDNSSKSIYFTYYINND